MTQEVFLRVIEFRHACRQPRWYEQRVIAEAARAFRFRCDEPLPGSLGQHGTYVISGAYERDHTAVARAACRARHAGEFLQQLCVVGSITGTRPRVARRPDT